MRQYLIASWRLNQVYPSAYAGETDYRLWSQSSRLLRVKVAAHNGWKLADGAGDVTVLDRPNPDRRRYTINE